MSFLQRKIGTYELACIHLLPLLAPEVVVDGEPMAMTNNTQTSVLGNLAGNISRLSAFRR